MEAQAPPEPTIGTERWLAVGVEGAAAIATLLADDPQPPTVTAVPSFLAAVGELGREPAGVVIGSLASVKGMAAPVARSLRDLAPRAKLLLLTDGEDPAAVRAALRAGFDAALDAPLTADKLRRAIADQPPPPLRTATPDAAGFASDPGPDSDEDIGDVDLIDRLLRGERVQDLALRVVEQRAGIDGLRLARDEAEVPEGYAASRLALRGREFGVLCAPSPAHDRDLAPWAEWLARWLALDEQVSLLKDMSMRDALTGMWNRRYFDRFLHRILEWAGRERSQVTLLVFDIDDFKRYNDTYGHAAGDEILRETSKLMQSVVRENDVVARIGGDEFAVIFWESDPRKPRKEGSRHPQSVVAAARRFQTAVVNHSFPKLFNEAPGTLTISGGLASFPWDGRTPEELLDRADQMALQSKRRGKNAITLGPGAEQSLRESGG